MVGMPYFLVFRRVRGTESAGDTCKSTYGDVVLASGNLEDLPHFVD